MLIGITGALGAGKGTVAEYLAKKHSFMYLSVRNFFSEEVLRRGQAVTRPNVAAVARAIRADAGPTHAVATLLARAVVGARGIVIESIRTTEEAALLQSKGGVMWCIDAELKNRYQRFIGRALPADALSFEQFAEQDKKDMSTDDPANQNLPEVCKMAKVFINNNGSKEELFAQIEKALAEPVA